MSQLTSKTDRCNNNPLDGSQHEQQSNQEVVLPFPGFIVNKTNAVEDYTPIAKIPCGSVQKCANSVKPTEETPSTTTTKTPPVEPSVSPEIQSKWRQSAQAAPSTCYGAGHVLSGVIDRRKCKARGILSVGRSKPLERDISEDNINCVSHGSRRQHFYRKSRPSMVPFPTEASITWHLSPSHVDNDDVIGQVAYPKGSHQSSEIVDSAALPSPSSRNRSLCTLSNPELLGLKSSPCGTPEPLISQEERISSFEFNSECSPFSGTSLSSRNVMQTPNSDSSLERHVGLLWLKEGTPKHQFETELDHVTDILQDARLSPLLSPLDPPRSGFELEDLSSPSNLTSLNHPKKNSDSHGSWISDSTFETLSMSRMRISWKDGLVNGTSDKDNLDCCRLLSDEEMDADELLKSPTFLDHKVNADGNDKETSVQIRLDPCVESICTDGNGLTASGDSDWTLYYKNHSVEI